MRKALLWVPILAVVPLGCGDDAPLDPSPTGGSTGSGAPTGEWVSLVEGDWSLEPGTEGYTCVVATVPETISIQAFRPIAPEGTHHTVLTRAAFGPDGVFDCDAATNGPDMIYGSGVGTEALALPSGVAVTLQAGEKLLLNLHLFNPTGDPLTGLSGVEVQRADPAATVAEATNTLAGTVGINISPQSTKTETGYCTLPSPATIFAVAPHMHQYGTHMTVTAEAATGSTVLLDRPYTFDDQAHYPLDQAVNLRAGERVRVDCTYDNTSNETVTFGDSSLQEMCFAGLFMFPASAAFGVTCTN